MSSMASPVDNITSTYGHQTAPNMSSQSSTNQINSYYHVFRHIETYFVPFICTLGLICNIIAVLTFLHKDLRKHSCSVFLVTRSISDSLFLLNLAIIYISHSFDVQINNVSLICQILNFVAYVSAFISVWSVILVTCENYIRILHPFETGRLCTQRNAKISIAILLIVAFGVNHFSLWISDKNCVPSAEFKEMTQAFVYIDTILTLVLPTMFLTFLVIAIIGKIIQTHEKRDRFRSASSPTSVNTRLVTKPKRNSDSKMAAVTKMLLAVSLSFFILTVPSHIVRIKILIGAFVRGYSLTSNTEAAVQGIAQLIYYTSMSINLFIYLIFGDNFRRVFRRIFLKGDGEIDKNVDTEIRHITPFSTQALQTENEVSDECKTTTL